MNMKVRLYLCYGLLKENLQSPFVLCACLLGGLAVFKSAYPYIHYADSALINVFEPFIILCSDRNMISWALFGYFFLMCRAPFMNARTEQMMFRITRVCWSDAVILYIFVQSVIYYGLILLMTVLIGISNGFVGNQWSNLMYNLSKFGSGVEKETGLYVPDVSLIKTWSVGQAVIHSFCLVLLYSIVLALILFAINIAVGNLIGCIVAIGVHFIGYVLISDAMFGYINFSLFAHGILNIHNQVGMGGLDLLTSYLLFFMICIFLIKIARVAISHCDLKNSIDERK